jgi:hypothetical protein
MGRGMQNHAASFKMASNKISCLSFMLTQKRVEGWIEKRKYSYVRLYIGVARIIPKYFLGERAWSKYLFKIRYSVQYFELNSNKTLFLDFQFFFIRHVNNLKDLFGCRKFLSASHRLKPRLGL